MPANFYIYDEFGKTVAPCLGFTIFSGIFKVKLNSRERNNNNNGILFNIIGTYSVSELRYSYTVDKMIIQENIYYKTMVIQVKYSNGKLS